MKSDKLKKYPEIGPYRAVINAVTNKTRYFGKDENGDPIYNNDSLPTLNFRFTSKGHGANGSIGWLYNPTLNDYERHTQSRERVITPLDDNAGFSLFVERINSDLLFKNICLHVLTLILEPEFKNDMYHNEKIDDMYQVLTHPSVRIYGEWLGKGIQSGMATNQVDKFFMIFGVKVNNIWVPDELTKHIKLEDERIFNIFDVETKELLIDFNNPKDYTELFDSWVDEIEKQCPIGTFLGVKGLGEGWVAKPTDPKWHSGRYFFKIKGEKHKNQNKGNKKKKISIDPVKVENLKNLLDEIVDDGRLSQGITKLVEFGHPVDIKSMGFYLKWLSDDTMSEELDTIITNGFTPKEVTKEISKKGRKYFMEYLDKQIGL